MTAASLEKPEERGLLSLLIDVVFKAVYGRGTPESNAALIALLNCLLERDDDPIVSLVCKNPFSYKSCETDKEIIMDIKADLSSGELIDIELQVGHLTHYAKRVIFYSGKLISETLDSGKKYGRMKKSIVISILQGKLLPGPDNAFSTYYWMNPETGHILETIAQIKFLELGKIDAAAKPISEMTNVERLGAYFKYASDKTKRAYVDELLKYIGEVITLTETILQEVSEEEQMRHLAFSREMFQHDMASLLAEAEEAREAGLAAGREEGETKKLIEQVCKKLRKEKTAETIADELEEDIAIIKEICEVAKSFAPDYDIETIQKSYRG